MKDLKKIAGKAGIRKWHRRHRVLKKQRNRHLKWSAKLIHKVHQRHPHTMIYSYMTRREIYEWLRRVAKESNAERVEVTIHE